MTSGQVTNLCSVLRHFLFPQTMGLTSVRLRYFYVLDKRLVMQQTCLAADLVCAMLNVQS